MAKGGVKTFAGRPPALTKEALAERQQLIASLIEDEDVKEILGVLLQRARLGDLAATSALRPYLAIRKGLADA